MTFQPGTHVVWDAEGPITSRDANAIDGRVVAGASQRVKVFRMCRRLPDAVVN